MPQFSINNPGNLTRTVSGIADTLFGAPDANAHIQGALDASLANQRNASARYDTLRGDRQAIYNDSLTQLQEAMRTNPALFSTPEGASLAASLALGAGNDPRQYIEALPGAAMIVNPNVFGENTSQVLLGTGAVNDFGNTEAGHTREMDVRELGDILAAQTDLSQTRMQQAGMAERLQAEQQFMLNNPEMSSAAPGRAPGFDGDPLDVARLREAVTELLDTGGIGGLNDQVRLWAQQRALDLVQQDGMTAATAVSQVLRDLQGAERGRFGLGSILVDSLPQIGQPGPLIQQGPAQGLTTLQGGTEGEIRVSPSTGRTVMFTNGQWVEVTQ